MSIPKCRMCDDCGCHHCRQAPAATIAAAVGTRMLVDGVPHTVPAILGYDSTSPYQVQITFLSRGTQIAWVVARDLLDDGLTRPAGLGDARIWPVDGWHIAVELHSDDGRALVLFHTGDLVGFLADTYAAVPPGHEALDVDAAIRHLLGATR